VSASVVEKRRERFSCLSHNHTRDTGCGSNSHFAVMQIPSRGMHADSIDTPFTADEDSDNLSCDRWYRSLTAAESQQLFWCMALDAVGAAPELLLPVPIGETVDLVWAPVYAFLLFKRSKINTNVLIVSFTRTPPPQPFCLSICPFSEQFRRQVVSVQEYACHKRSD